MDEDAWRGSFSALQTRRLGPSLERALQTEGVMLTDDVSFEIRSQVMNVPPDIDVRVRYVVSVMGDVGRRVELARETFAEAMAIGNVQDRFPAELVARWIAGVDMAQRLVQARLVE